MGTNDFSEGNAVQRKVSTVLVHPYWNKATYDNDLALLKLDSKVTLSKTLQPICLPDIGENSFIGKYALVLKYSNARAIVVKIWSFLIRLPSQNAEL